MARNSPTDSTSRLAVRVRRHAGRRILMVIVLVVMVAVVVVVVIARVELLAPVHDRVLVSLVDLDLVQQLRLGHHQLEGVPDEEGHVLGGTWLV